MRIAILGTRGIPANYSGFETCVQETASLFSAYGHAVRVYCRSGRVGSELDNIQGIETVFVPFIPGKHVETLSHTFLSIVHLAFQRVDCVHVYGAGNGWLVPILRLLRFRVLFLVDGIDWQRAKWGRAAKWFLRQGASIGTRSAQVSIADSEKVIEKLSKHLPGRSLQFVPYGARLLGSGGGTPRILSSLGLAAGEYYLFVGRFVPEKNIHLLIDAFRKANSRRRLVLVGGASYGGEYEKALRAAGNQEVIFPGFVFGRDYEDLLVNCYVYVQPSALEGTSPSLLAAMGAGCCVLVSDIPENVETVSNAGFYFQSNSAESLTQMIGRLDKNPEDVKLKGEGARKRVENHYSWVSVTSKLLKLSSDA